MVVSHVTDRTEQKIIQNDISRQMRDDYPLGAWYLFLTTFAGGLVSGWLRKRRDRLLAPGIAHGLVG